MRALPIAFILAGCAAGSTYAPSAIEIPCEWQSKTPASMYTGSPGDVIWWENLQDHMLNELIDYAACTNPDMRIAAVHVQQARNSKEAEFLQDSWQETWITISTDIAKSYIELRGLQQKLRIVQRMIEVQNETIELTKELVDRGVVDEIGFSSAQAECHTLKSQPAFIEASIARAIHHLSVLLGSPPGELFKCLKMVSPMPKLPVGQPIGLPSDLLCRRPDIRKAEREYALKPTWEGYYSYQKTVLGALEESENAIASYRYGEEHLCNLIDAYHKYQQALEFSKVLIQRGVNDTLTAAAAKKAILSAEQALIQSQVALLQHYVELYKALGGNSSD